MSTNGMAIAENDKRNTGGGWNRKSLEQHLAEGTYRRDRHGDIGPLTLGWKPKPPGKVRSTARAQNKWIQSPADEHAVANGCRFNEALAVHVCEFFPRFLRHSKGEWAGKPFALSEWQVNKLIYPLFGWVRPDGTRRFRRTYIEIPKKNYKSTTAAGIGLYGLCGDEEPGAEIYSLGADKDQARIVHSEAINMVEASDVLANILKINRTTGTITYPAMRSAYKVLSAAPRGKHGINAHYAVIDELHEWYGDELWNSMQYAYRARRQPLQFVITNAGDDIQSICYSQRQKAEALIAGRTYDDSFFALICSVPEDEAKAELEKVREGARELPVARSVNPGLGHVIREENLVEDIRNALDTPREIPNLLRLTYGVWCQSEETWLDKTVWDANKQAYTLDDLAGWPCFGGLDLSKTRDMTAFVLLFPDCPEEQHYRQLAWFWLPEETIKHYAHLLDMQRWVNDGWLRSTPGAVVSYAVVRQDIADILQQVECQGLAYDRHYALETVQWLEEQTGVEPVEFQQTIMQFAGPTAAYDRLLGQRALHHNGNAVLSWQASHCQVKADVNANIRPVKPKQHEIKKIDGIVAGIMALGLALRVDTSSAYESGGVMYADDIVSEPEPEDEQSGENIDTEGLYA